MDHLRYWRERIHAFMFEGDGPKARSAEGNKNPAAQIIIHENFT